MPVVRAHSITRHAAGVKRVQEQRELCDSKHAACTIGAQTVKLRGSGAVYHLHVLVNRFSHVIYDS